MDFKLFIKYFIIYIILVLLQVTLLNNISITSLEVSPFLYILLILIISFEVPNWIILFIAFIIGLTIDIFSNTIAIHTAASVFIAFVRPAILNILSPRDGYKVGSLPGIKDLGFVWFLKYSIILSFVHSIFFFFLEAFSFHDIHLTLLKILFTTILSTIIIMLSQFFVFRRS